MIRFVFGFLTAAALFLTAPMGAQDKKDLPDPKMPKGRAHKTGAKPTPRAKIFAAKKFTPTVRALPQVAYVPAKLHVWGNDQYGDCVSAEEAFNQAVCGTLLDDQTVIKWASDNGFLNGADLAEVMDAMAKSGMVSGGKTYGDGPYSAVDYSNESVLQAALSIAPVKIAIDAGALPSGAGNQQGWYALGKGNFPNTDHCVAIAGFGPADYLYQKLSVTMPPNGGFVQGKTYYLLFTWGTIGVVDHEWLMSTTTEAWLRNPDVTIDGKPQPNPGPQPTPPANAYTLWEAAKQVGPTTGFGDLAQAVSAAQAIANTDKLPVDIKDASGKIVQTVQPNGPTPPTPTPNGTGFSGSVTYTYAGGVLTSVTTGAGNLEAELKQAGVSPNIIADTLQLVADLKAGAGFATLVKDALKIAEDMISNAPPEQRRGLKMPTLP